MRPPLRFSLRSLLLLILAGGAAVAAGMKWEAWQLTLKLVPTGYEVRPSEISPDGRLILTTAHTTSRREDPWRQTVWTFSGEEVFRSEWWPEDCFACDARFLSSPRWLLQTALFQEPLGKAQFQLFDLNSKKALFPKDVQVSHLSFTDDCRRCVAWLVNQSGQYKFAAYNLESNSLIWEIGSPFPSEAQIQIPELQISADGRYALLFGTEPKDLDQSKSFLVVVDLETSAHRISRQAIHALPSFSSDGSRIVAVGPNSIQIIDVATDEMLFEKLDLDCTRGDLRSPSNGAKVVYYELDGAVSWIDVNAPKIAPFTLPDVSLTDCKLSGSWIVWRRKDTLLIKDAVSGTETIKLLSITGKSLHWGMGDTQFGISLYTFSDQCVYFDKRSQRVFSTKSFLMLSPDGKRAITGGDAVTNIHSLGGLGVGDACPGPVLGTIHRAVGTIFPWSPDGNAITEYSRGNEAVVWSRVRDDSPGAFLFQPELWLAIAFALAFIWSVYDNVRRRRASDGMDKSP